MKAQHTVFVLAVLIGLSVWMVEAAADSLVFHQGSFPRRLILNLSRQELYRRSMVTLLVVGFGAGVSAYLVRRGRPGQVPGGAELQKAGILNSVSEQVVFHDTNLTIQWANSTAAASVGMSPSEIKGRHCYELWQERSTPCEGCPVVEALKTGRPQQAEKTSPGGRTWMVRGYPLRDEKGKVSGVVELTLEITQRRRAEEALVASESRYRLLAENVTDAIWTADMDLRFTYVSPSAQVLTGYACEELLSAPVTDILCSSSLETVRKVFQEELSVEQAEEKDLSRSRTVDVELRRKDGSTVWAEVKCTFVRDAAGVAVAILGVARDATERRHTLEALRESEQNFRALAENAMDGIVILTGEGRIVYGNTRAAEIGGYTVAELLGSKIDALAHPDFLSMMAEMYRKRVEGKLDSARYEAQIVRKDGRSVPLEISSGRTTWRGQPADMAIVRDITDRKQAGEALRESEERFRNLMQYIPGISIQGYRTDGTVFYWNKASEAVYGYTAEEAVGKDLGDLIIPPDLLPLFRECLELGKKVKRSGEFMPAGELLLLHKQGHLVPVYSIHTAVYAEGKEPLLFCIDVDLSERQKAERVLRQYQRAVEGSEDLIAAVNRDYVYLLVNDAFLKYHRLAREDVIGRTVPDVVGTDVFEKEVKPRVDRCFAGQAVQYEMMHRSPSGEQRCLDVLYQPLRGDGEEPTGLVGIMRDITSRKQAEEHLHYRLQLEDLITSISTNFINVAPDAIDEQISDALRKIGQFAGVDRSYVFLLSRDGTKITNTHEWCADGVAPRSDRHRELSLGELPWAAGAIRSREVLHVPHVAGLPPEAAAEREGFQAEGIRSLISVPMVLGPSVVGLVGLDSVRAERSWPDDVIALLRNVGEVFANAIARKRAADALRESERMLSTLMSNLPGMAYRCANDPDWTTEYTSEGCLALTGYHPEEFQQNAKTSYAEIIHPEDRQQVWDDVQAALTEHKPFQLTYRILTAAGELKWVWEQGRGVFSPAGELEALEGLLVDITERVRAEEALRESEERYRLLVETMREGLGATDENHVFTYVNRAFAEMLGRSREEMVGRHITEFVHEDYQEIVNSQIAVRREGQYRPFEVAWAAKDGRTVHTLASPVAIMGPEGKFLGSFGVLTDITDLKAAQEALRMQRDFAESLVETAQAIIILVDPGGRVMRMNKFAQDVTGYTEQEVTSTDAYELFLPPEARARSRFLLGRIVSGRKPLGVVYPMFTKKGRQLQVRWASSVIRGANGEVTGVLAIGHDITEMQEKEQQLRQAATMEAIGRLAGGIAHDFNNMLGIIKGYADLLGKSLAGDDQRQADLEKIREASARAAGLTRQLLALGRKQVVRTRVLQLNETILAMDSMLRRTIGDDIDLKTIPAGDLWHVMADPTQLEQVILNLVVNAREAMPKGGKLIIRTDNVTLDDSSAGRLGELSPGEYVMLTVIDTGVGMSEEVRSHIFEPFFTTKRMGDGTGLGLSTCYGIVKQSAGHILVEGAPGEGTSIRIYLPRIEAGPAEAYEAVGRPGRLPRGTERVMVVEDELAMRQLACRVLREQGYRVLEASNAEQAIALAAKSRKRPIHLLLTDVLMPRVSGKELAEQFKTLRPEARILFVSGYPDDDLIHRGALEKGVNFLAKPFSPRELTETVRRVLDAEEG